jgi:hypothetical protein
MIGPVGTERNIANQCATGGKIHGSNRELALTAVRWAMRGLVTVGFIVVVVSLIWTVIGKIRGRAKYRVNVPRSASATSGEFKVATGGESDRAKKFNEWVAAKGRLKKPSPAAGPTNASEHRDRAKMFDEWAAAQGVDLASSSKDTRSALESEFQRIFDSLPK